MREERSGRKFVFFICIILCSSYVYSSDWVWSEEVGEQYLFYAYAAYCNNSLVQNWTCKWCQEPAIANFTPTAFPYDAFVNGYGYIGYNHVNETIVVSFRGTQENSIRNWIVDLTSLKMIPYKNSTTLMVGEGGYKEWNDLMPQVIPAVQSLRNLYPNYSIYVTGHSLGAGISVLCALELVEEGFTNVNVYNYGCPRVGNQAFASYYNSLVPNTFRVVNGRDIVPHLPPEELGFVHPPTEVWENPPESFTFKVCSSTDGEDPKCSDSVLFPDSVYDHLHYFGYYEDCGPDMAL